MQLQGLLAVYVLVPTLYSDSYGMGSNETVRGRGTYIASQPFVGKGFLLLTDYIFLEIMILCVEKWINGKLLTLKIKSILCI
jgi:hypothetical protein